MNGENVESEKKKKNTVKYEKDLYTWDGTDFDEEPVEENSGVRTAWINCVYCIQYYAVEFAQVFAVISFTLASFFNYV